ncbi:MAG: TlpA family protein disulfide reductase [Thermodesulfovibrionales bacterium]|nr:TlpA family protein disulfide reductase [Thermodesulfovibrionales bacterium]
MKQKAIILAIIFLIGITLVFLIDSNKSKIKTKASVGLDAPYFELKDIDNKLWKLSDLKGKVILLNFWATWCETCKIVNSSLDNLIKTRTDENVVLLSILYKDTPSNAIEYMKKNGFTFPVLIDDKNVANIYGISGIPETFIINKKGLIKDKIIGPIKWDSPMVKTAIEQFASE